MNTLHSPIRPGARVVWASFHPRRRFAGRVRTVGRRTAHVETLRADGRLKLRYVKLARLRMEGGAWR